jgi:hypothetical protein
VCLNTALKGGEIGHCPTRIVQTYGIDHLSRETAEDIILQCCGDATGERGMGWLRDASFIAPWALRLCKGLPGAEGCVRLGRMACAENHAK